MKRRTVEGVARSTWEAEQTESPEKGMGEGRIIRLSLGEARKVDKG